MRAGLQSPDLAPNDLAPSLADALAHQTLQYRFDIDAGRVWRGAHHGLRFANGKGIIDREPQADVMNGIAGLKFAAETVVLYEGLGVEKPRLDFPQSVVAEVAVAFDRSAMHQATPAAVVLIGIGHFLFVLAGESLALALLADPDDHLSKRRTGLHGREGIAKILESKYLADNWIEFLFREPCEQLGHHPPLRLRLTVRNLGDVDAQQDFTLQKRQVERQCRDASGGESDHKMTAAPGDRTKGLQGDIAAHRIEDHIGTMTAGQVLERVAPIRPRVIHRGVGAEAGCKLPLLLGRGCGNDAGAQQFADLNRGDPDAARGTQYQKILVRAQRSPLAQCIE